jgi:hypothetical protein
MYDPRCQPSHGKASMSLATSTHDATTVYVVGPDVAVRSAISRLLELDPQISVLGSSDAVDPRSPVADVVIDESLLHDLRELSVADFIAMVKSLAGPERERYARTALRP